MTSKPCIRTKTALALAVLAAAVLILASCAGTAGKAPAETAGGGVRPEPSALKEGGRDNLPPNTDWYTSGGDSEFFSISAAEELAALAAIVNGALEDDGIPKYDFRGKTIKLTDNIDLSQYDNWVPIGAENGRFRGTFDGGGHAVSNLTINRRFGHYQGLFGYVEAGSVKNLSAESVNIRACENAGGIVGIMRASAAIINCHTAGKIGGRGAIGGIVGYVAGNSSVINCHSDAAVIAANESAGGLAGKVEEGTVSNSYFAGSVGGELDAVLGGLVGEAMSGSVITGSYSTGVVAGTEKTPYKIGGLIGDATGRVSDCAALGSQTANGHFAGRVAGRMLPDRYSTKTSNNGAFAGMKNGDGNTDWPGRGADGKSGADITFADIMADPTLGGRFTEENGWTLEKGKLPGLRGKAVEVPEHIRKLSVILPEKTSAVKGGERQFNMIAGGKAENGAVRWTVSGNASKATAISADGKLTVGANESAKIIAVCAKSKTDSTQSHTASVMIREAPDTRWYSKNPNAKIFTIATGNELLGLAEIVNGTWGGKPASDNFRGKTVKLASDIHLSRNEADSWIPIGNCDADYSAAFSGTFDGGGFAIRNLTINSIADSVNIPDNEFESDYQSERALYGIPVYYNYLGLFGRVAGGRVENLGLTGVNVNGYGYVGVVAGEIDSSSVVSCHTEGAVGYAGNEEGGHYDVGGHTGGIVGVASGNSIVANSYSSCKVPGGGGIAGWVTNSSVTGCYFIGSTNGCCGVALRVWNGSITNSAVLNSTIVGSYSGKRVARTATDSFTLENNAAYYIEMEDKYRATRIPAHRKGANTAYGADITAAQIRADGTIGGRFTAKNGWTVKNGRLPGLGGKTVEMPKHLRADIPEIDRFRMRIPEKYWDDVTKSAGEAHDDDHDFDDYECVH